MFYDKTEQDGQAGEFCFLLTIFFFVVTILCLSLGFYRGMRSRMGDYLEKEYMTAAYSPAVFLSYFSRYRNGVNIKEERTVKMCNTSFSFSYGLMLNAN